MIDPYKLISDWEFVYTQENGYRASAVPKSTVLAAMAQIEHRAKVAEGERDLLKALLKELEWAAGEDVEHCPECYCTKENGHKEHCALEAAIEETS